MNRHRASLSTLKQPNSAENLEFQKHQSPVIRGFALFKETIWRNSTTLARALQ
jgi:hypothetical protein